jgi:hypothetical protein
MKKTTIFSLSILIYCIPSLTHAEPTLSFISNLESNNKKQVLGYDATNSELKLYALENNSLKEISKQALIEMPHRAIAWDNKIFVAVGSSLKRQADPTKLISYSDDLKNPEVVFELRSGRNQVTSLFADLDGLYMTHFIDTYHTEIHKFTKKDNKYSNQKIYSRRMAMYNSLVSSDTILVGRPYGDTQSAIGDAFIYFKSTDSTLKLDTLRGASFTATANLDADPELELLVADGWDQDYGKVARAQISLYQQNADKSYSREIILEDSDQHRFEDLQTINCGMTMAILARGNKKVWILRHNQTNKKWEPTLLHTITDEATPFGIAAIGTDANQVVYALIKPELSLEKTSCS